MTNAAGMIFNHKDKKKGQRDADKDIFARRVLGRSINAFPDTSNTGYQSHCEASTELVVHLPHYITFLELV